MTIRRNYSCSYKYNQKAACAMSNPAQYARMSDEEIILLFQRGDDEAFDVLVSRYKDPLMNYITRYIGNVEDAQDVLQETFIRLYIKKDLYRTVAKFSTWIYTIAINQARTVMRKSKRRSFVSISPSDSFEEAESEGYVIPDSTPLPDELAAASLKHDRIQRALLDLKAEYRETLILRDIQNLEYEEIAQILDVPLGTVKSRINRGRASLQKSLQDIYD